MNEVFLIGKILTEIVFKFLYQSQKNSICYFGIELKNGSKVFAKGFDEGADFCFSNLKKGNTIFIEGKLNSKMEVIIEKINIIQ